MAHVFYSDPTTPFGRASLYAYNLRRRLIWLPRTVSQLPDLLRGFVHGWREGGLS